MSYASKTARRNDFCLIASRGAVQRLRGISLIRFVSDLPNIGKINL